jgi:cytochrome c553
MSAHPARDTGESPTRSISRWLRRWVPVLALIGAGAAAIGFLVAASGVMPIKASSGHWPITRWFLDFAMRRSVKTHSVGIDIPEMNQVRAMTKAAGHFESGCAPCHGRPGETVPRVLQQMTPKPPSLAGEIPRWDPEELFYIVKHGVKFTGMPGWPAQERDDEVWSMVAFLLEVPSLSTEDYLRLVLPDPSPESSTPVLPLEAMTGTAAGIVATCARCHGWDGQGRGQDFSIPNLAGQKAGYLERALDAYAQGQRHSGIMETVAAALSEAERVALAKHYSRLPRPPATQPSHLEEAEAVLRGEVIAMRGIPEQKVPSCADCHGPGPTPTIDAYPDLTGLSAEYMVLQLDLFKKEKRGGSAYAAIMHHIAPKLTEVQKREVASYYASRGADASNTEQSAAAVSPE